MARPLTVTAYNQAQVDTAKSKSGSGSLLLDGSSTNEDYLTVAQANGELNVTGSWTIEAWFYNDLSVLGDDTIISAPQQIVSAGQTYWWQLKLKRNSGSIDLSFYTEGGANSGTVTKNYTTLGDITGAWHHVAVTRNGSTLKLWLDGVSQATATSQSYTDLQAFDDPFVSNNNIWIGALELSGPTQEYDGWIDEVRISNVERYTATFTPATRFAPDDNTLLLLHMDGADGSTTFTDDIGVRGSSSLTSTATLSATANPNPSIVFLGNDVYTWADTDTWDTIYDSFDRWRSWERPDYQFTLSARGTKAVYGSAGLSAEFTQTAKGGITLPTANASLSAIATQTATAQRLPGGNANLTSTATVIVIAQRLPQGSANLNASADISARGQMQLNGHASLSASADLFSRGRLLKIAEMTAFSTVALSASAEVQINARANLSAAFDQFARGGLLVQINETWQYTWDTIDPDEWDSFVKDQWGPTGWFAFDNVSLSATGGILVDGRSSLSDQFNLVARADRIIKGQSNLESISALTANANRLPGGSAQLESTASLFVSAINFKRSSSALDTQFDLSAKGSRILQGQSTLEAFAAQLAVGQRLPQAKADLTATFSMSTRPTLIPNVILDPMVAVTDVTVNGQRFAGGSAVLEAFASELTVGQRLPGGKANLSAQCNLSTTGSMILNGRAEFQAFASELASGRISNVRASASLTAEFQSVFSGDLKLFDSEFMVKVLSETRSVLIDSEIRKQLVLEETRSWDIKPENRNFKILEETRSLDVEFL